MQIQRIQRNQNLVISQVKFMSRRNPTWKELANKHKCVKKSLRESQKQSRRCKKCFQSDIEPCEYRNDGKQQFKCSKCSTIHFYGKNGYKLE